MGHGKYRPKGPYSTLRSRIDKRRHAAASTGMLLLSCLLSPAGAQGAEVRYTLSRVDETNWVYHYTVTHDGNPRQAPLRQFAIGFDPALYREPSLRITTPIPLSNAWDERLLASGLALEAFYDVQANTNGLIEGESQFGFSLHFEWIGPGMPGDQPFWVFAPGNPVSVQQGRTSAAALTVPMGGPWLNILLAWLLLSLAVIRLSTRPRQTGER